MRLKFLSITQAFAATCIAILCIVISSTFSAAPSQAYVADKAKLDKAAACDAGKYAEGASQFKQLANEGTLFAQCITNHEGSSKSAGKF